VSWVDVEVNVSLVGRTGGLPVAVPVTDVEVLRKEEDEVEDVSVLTTVVVWVLLPVDDAETVKVWVTTIVVTNVEFITPKQMSL